MYLSRMIKLKPLSNFSEYDKSEIDDTLNNISIVSNNLDMLERKMKIKRFDESLNCKSSDNELVKEIHRNWNTLKKLSEDLDYLFDDV